MPRAYWNSKTEILSVIIGQVFGVLKQVFIAHFNGEHSSAILSTGKIVLDMLSFIMIGHN